MPRMGLKGRAGLCMAASIAWATVSGKRTVRPLCHPQSIRSRLACAGSVSDGQHSQLIPGIAGRFASQYPSMA